MRGGRGGRKKLTMSSPLPSEVRPGAVTMSSTGTPERRPAGPAISQVTPAAIIAGVVSAAGEALHRFPPSEARPWICVEPMSSNASSTPGHMAATASFSATAAPGAAAPTRNPPPSSRTARSSGMCLRSTTISGEIILDRSCTMRSVPPASGLAFPPASASRAAAASTVSGASYRMDRTMASPSSVCKAARFYTSPPALRQIGPAFRPPRSRPRRC